ncbi:hypothetical protein K461DRAFT_294667 [Myriangium duriaei CBS 260.36]|uniref:Glutamyl-tRNA amidotransferase complex subunit Gta3 domain-containing protein n=1 Tax=Myriangium duriaei CBS 260.36 TaxID=1168546 RepID=A0A9P4MLI7_9PEZI|nr:hypothetical protein K461DRAFT_294667 [Myriangium duriaei CBS 260.36]
MPPRLRISVQLRPSTIHIHFPVRSFSSTTTFASQAPTKNEKISPADLLATPSWDPSSLVPTPDDIRNAASHITPAQLRHLLRLSGLSPPSSPAEEQEMLATLGAQLHFVRQVQAAAASGDVSELEPLRSLRDETEEGIRESEVGRETLADVLNKEDLKGKYYPRPRRRKDVQRTEQDEEKWDVFANASRKVGRYFVVERVKT